MGNSFGVSVAFVCTSMKEVCEAIRNKIASAISFPYFLIINQGYDVELDGDFQCGVVVQLTDHIPILDPNEPRADMSPGRGTRGTRSRGRCSAKYLFRWLTSY